MADATAVDSSSQSQEKPPSMLPSFLQSGSRHHSYSRKQKSLGLLCTNFLSLYNRDGVETVGLDDAASRLGVERRRIYDIVNVLESVGVLTRKAKNRYTWIGFRGIPKALEELKSEGLETYSLNFYSGGSSYSKGSDGEDDDRSCDSKTGSKQDNCFMDQRREKSLGLLTENFVKLFICTDNDLVTLDDAAKSLLGAPLNSSRMRNTSAAKVRRLYDIANVLSSMSLIEKMHHPESRKPAFRWLGLDGKSENRSAGVVESRKRTFGTELTNIDYKRNKSSMFDVKPEKRCDEMTNGEDINGKLHHSGSVDFGPFIPLSLPKVGRGEKSGEKSERKVQDWESLASSYRPQYHNQALSDLFAHYMEAWKSWYVEVAGNQPIQQLS